MTTQSKFKTIAHEHLQELRQTLAETRTEIAAILAIFPDLTETDPAQPATDKPVKSKRRPLTPAERRAVSIRMKRYHRKRRKAAKEAARQKKQKKT